MLDDQPQLRLYGYILLAFALAYLALVISLAFFF